MWGAALLASAGLQVVNSDQAVYKMAAAFIHCSLGILSERLSASCACALAHDAIYCEDITEPAFLNGVEAKIETRDCL
jgi:hypothetical protein